MMADPTTNAAREFESANSDRENYQWPSPLNFLALSGVDPVPPEWIVEKWVIAGYAFLISAHGGSGKSIIELMKAICIALGIPFFGYGTSRRRVYYMSCEDRIDILHWRLKRICDYLNVSMADLDGWLFVNDLVGHDCVLWARDPLTRNCFTPAFGRLSEEIERTSAEVLVVDGVSDTFGGNENIRSEPKGYINALVGLMPKHGAVILIAHIDKALARSNGSSSDGYSGSTAWHNSVRGRAYLRPEKDVEDGNATGKMVLELQKSNHGSSGEQIEFTWDDDAGTFVGRTVSAFDAVHRDKEEQRGILLALHSCGEEPVPAAQTGTRTIYHVLSARPQFPKSLVGGSVRRKRFNAHVERLRAMRQVEDGTYTRKDRHKIRTIVITAEGMRACGQYD